MEGRVVDASGSDLVNVLKELFWDCEVVLMEDGGAEEGSSVCDACRKN